MWLEYTEPRGREAGGPVQREEGLGQGALVNYGGVLLCVQSDATECLSKEIHDRIFILESHSCCSVENRYGGGKR